MLLPSWYFGGTMLDHTSQGRTDSFLDNGLIYSFFIGLIMMTVWGFLSILAIKFILKPKEMDWVPIFGFIFIYTVGFIGSHYSNVRRIKGKSPYRRDLNTYQVRKVASDLSLDEIEDTLRGTKKWKWSKITRTDSGLELKTKKNWFDDWSGYVFRIELISQDQERFEYKLSTKPAWPTISADFGKSYKFSNQLVELISS